jgi:hypothetical protein
MGNFKPLSLLMMQRRALWKRQRVKSPQALPLVLHGQVFLMNNSKPLSGSQAMVRLWLSYSTPSLK